MNTAVLFLIFNRPETTSQVFEAIRKAKPARLYVAADGPRPGRPGEIERCQEARRIATAVDWPCELHTFFRDENQGCKLGVVAGINWFFEQEEEGIILEDDVLPVPSFFPYCEALLARYRDDDRVAMITGCNPVSSDLSFDNSYFFSRYPFIWGWASWRRAWKHYDVTMTDWPAWQNRNGFNTFSGKDWGFKEYWEQVFRLTYSGKISTWDYQWVFSCWNMNALAILPAKNQISNLGFGKDATHTTFDTPEYLLKSVPTELQFPLSHPDKIERNEAADTLIHKKVGGMTLFRILKFKIKNIAFLGAFLLKIKNSLRLRQKGE